MHIRSRFAAAVVAAVASIATLSACSSSGGKAQEQASSTASTVAAPVTPSPINAAAPADGVSGEDDLGGHLNGETIANPCLGITVAQFAATMGYEPNLVKPGSGDSCRYTVETKGHYWDVLARYETPSTFSDGVKRGNQWAKSLSGFPAGTKAWSINVNTGGIIAVAYLPKQKVALECSFLVSGGSEQAAIDKSTQLCRWYANIAVEKLPAIG